jgi:hypothetical protein
MLPRSDEAARHKSPHVEMSFWFGIVTAHKAAQSDRKPIRVRNCLANHMPETWPGKIANQIGDGL